MREIKFRGKRLDNGEWIVGLLTLDVKGHYRIQYDPMCFSVLVDPATVGQYTGLKDKNEKEIYEGDVLKITQVRPKSKPNRDRGIEIVKFGIWSGWSVGTRWDRYAFNPDNPIDVIEIIGNIHDNPEL